MNAHTRQLACHGILTELLPTPMVGFNSTSLAVAKLDDMAQIILAPWDVKSNLPDRDGTGEGFYIELLVNDLRMDGWPVRDPMNIRAALRALMQSLVDRYRNEALVAVKRLTRSDLSQDLMVAQARQAAQRLVNAEALVPRP